MEQPGPESILYLAITESQARLIAACDQTAIREIVVNCCRFMLDCEWGGLTKYRGQPDIGPSRRTRKRV
jgi:hypothetical protein